MIRARFLAALDDPRPVKWPIKYPYWISGIGEDHSIVIAYADDIKQIMELWPEATSVEVDEQDHILFTDRFPRPEWFNDIKDVVIVERK